MLCRELMRTPVIHSHLDDTASRTAAVMRSRKVGFLPVCDDDGRVVGTITDRDLCIRVLAECGQPNSASTDGSTPIRYVMTSGPVTCRPEDDLEFAEELMRKNHKGRIVCVDGDRKPVGIISLADIAHRDTPSRAGELLRVVSEREVKL